MNNYNKAQTKAAQPKEPGACTALIKFATFSGRATSKEFWRYIMLISFLNPILIVILSLPFWFNWGDPTKMLMCFSAIQILFFVTLISVSVRRLHDTNRSAWYLLLNLLPIVGQLILLSIFCFPSQQCDNKYGKNLSSSPSDGAISTALGVIMLIISLVVIAVILFMWWFLYSLTTIYPDPPANSSSSAQYSTETVDRQQNEQASPAE